MGQVIHSPDGTLLAVVGGTGVQVNDARTGDQRALFTAYTHQVLAVAISPDNQTVATGGDDGSIHLWNVDTSDHRSTLWAHTDTRSLTFSPDGRRLAGGGTGTIRLWDVDTGEALAVLEGGHSGPVLSMAFSPDGRTLASGGVYSKVHLWDLAASRLERTLESPLVLSVAFSPDGQTLASRSEDHEIQLWDTETGAHRHSLFRHTSAVFSMAFSPDGQTLAVGGGWPDYPVRLWDVKTGQRLATLKGHPQSILSVAFSPDGRTLASADADSTVLLWDMETGQSRTLEGHAKRVPSVSFSPDGTTLASGSWDLTTRLWDVESGGPKAILEGHRIWVTAVSFSPDSRSLVSAGGDKIEDFTIRLWDVDTGKHKATLDGHKDFVYSVSFSPDGNTLASGSVDGSILLWDMSPYVSPPTAVQASPTLPAETALLANYPNPFNPETWIPYRLQTPAHVRLGIYDLRGALVRILDLGHRPAGPYLTPSRAARWDGRDQRGEQVAGGVYLYRLEDGSFARAGKMVLLK